MVTYKETHAGAKIDPVPDVWTGTWRDSRPFNPEGAQPENALTGTIFTVNAWRNDPLIVPADFAGLRFWRDTDIAELAPGGSELFCPRDYSAMSGTRIWITGSARRG
ncbi:MAG: hypothetical protein CM1200mP20_09990 [Pseudomonadota bacterium]|nr:MAG: hypothetical protein CM1200mP20_09990 [Pseudomonadota bacterium]